MRIIAASIVTFGGFVGTLSPDGLARDLSLTIGVIGSITVGLLVIVDMVLANQPQRQRDDKAKAE